MSGPDVSTLLKIGRGLTPRDIGVLIANGLDEVDAFFLQCIGPDSLSRGIKGVIAATGLLAARQEKLVVSVCWVTVPGDTGQDISAILLECQCWQEVD